MWKTPSEYGDKSLLMCRILHNKCNCFTHIFSIKKLHDISVLKNASNIVLDVHVNSQQLTYEHRRHFNYLLIILNTICNNRSQNLHKESKSTHFWWSPCKLSTATVFDELFYESQDLAVHQNNMISCKQPTVTGVFNIPFMSAYIHHS